MSVHGFARSTPDVQCEILLDLAADCNFVSQEYAAEIRTIMEGPDVFVEVVDDNVIRINEHITAYLIIGTLYVCIELIVFNMP